MIDQTSSNFFLNLNWVDFVFIIFTIYFIVVNNGFINELFSALGFIFSVIASYKFYPFLSMVLVQNFITSKGVANVVGFFIVWMITEIVYYIIFSLFFSKIIQKIKNHPINISLGFVAAIIQSSFLFLFFISLIFVFPVNPVLKKDILQSKSGPFFIVFSRSIEINMKKILGSTMLETLNFLTIKPESDQTIDLGIRLNNNKLSNDYQSEVDMFNLVNKERSKNGLEPLKSDEKLKDIARTYARQMFSEGFFSHISKIDQSAPLTRAINAGAVFFVIGENLAYAPDIYVAHQGLMNSEGHRKNILSIDFIKLGIGVIDGGLFGKIFVQEFTD